MTRGSHRPRDLGWDGMYNVRDLGGLPLRGGGATRRGAIVRGDAPDRLTAAGWADAVRHGIRTVLDLREPGEDGPADPPPPGIDAVAVPLDGDPDSDFWREWGGGLNCTPLYFAAFLERLPERVGAVLRRIADAPQGGVLVHCSGGRDRTGLVTLVLLRLAGVEEDAIVADHESSTSRLEPLWRDRGLGDQTAKVAALLDRHGTTSAAVLRRTLAGFDTGSFVRASGLTGAQVRALRARLR